MGQYSLPNMCVHVFVCWEQSVCVCVGCAPLACRHHSYHPAAPHPNYMYLLQTHIQTLSSLASSISLLLSGRWATPLLTHKKNNNTHTHTLTAH